MTPDRLREKLVAYREAWRIRFGRVSTEREVRCGILPACHETQCGDSWKGPDGVLNTADDERNWGACNLRKVNADELVCISASGRELLAAAGIEQNFDQERLELSPVPMHWMWIDNDTEKVRRMLTAREAGALAPLTPTVTTGHEKRAKAAEAAIMHALPTCPGGVPPDGRRGHIHCDSHPGLGPFFVWFAAFDTDVAGCDYYLKIVTRTAAERAAIASGDPTLLARAMYQASYFGGFHPHVPGPGGDEANIADYARGLLRWLPQVDAAMAAA